MQEANLKSFIYGLLVGVLFLLAYLLAETYSDHKIKLEILKENNASTCSM